MAFDPTTVDSGSRRLALINEVVADVVARRSSGEPVSDDAVILAHPELAPELGQRIRTLDLIEQAHRDAFVVDDQTRASDERKFRPRGGSSAIDISTSPPVDAIAGYEIIREIHRGGQGVVYQAIQKATRRKVAIKVMHEGPFAGPRDRARFEREVQILGALNHPNIVGIHDSGTSSSGGFYYVMDYISGVPLDDYMAQVERSIDETLRLFVKICDAVSAAHLRGVIHRDLKPGNIRIDTAGEPHVLDFGLAKMAVAEVTDASRPQLMSVTGQFIGSLPWASPEQAQGIPEKIDVRTDVYSLGVVLYQMLTKKFPYEVVGNMRDVLDNILKAEPARPSTIRRQINDEVETIVLKCLNKERERRYQSAGELARDVSHYLLGEPIEAKRDSALYVLRKKMVRHRRGVLAASVTIIAVGTATVIGMSSMRASARMRAEAALRERAYGLTRMAAPLVQGRVEIGRAKDLLSESISLTATVDALMQRGIVRAMEGLAAPWSEKEDYVRRSLADLNAAWVHDGGSSFLQGNKVLPVSSANGASLEVLCQAIHVLILGHHDDEARTLLSKFAEGATGDAGRLVQGATPIYDIAHDPLVPRMPPDDTPENAHLSPDLHAKLRRVLPVEITSLDPRLPPVYASYITELIFDSLFVLDSDMKCVPNQVVVKKVVAKPDKDQWIIELNDGLFWHDGEPVTAYDVAFSWKQYEPGDPRILRLTAPDAHTVRVVGRYSQVEPFGALRFPILSQHRHLLSGSDAAFIEELRNSPVGSGPYKMDGVRSAMQVALTRWERYPAAHRPYIEKVVFLGIPDSRERMRLLSSDQADEMPLNSTEFRWDVNGDSFRDRVIKWRQIGLRYDFIAWNSNASNPFFADVRVRRALGKAIDIEPIRRHEYGELFAPYRGVWGYHPFARDREFRAIAHDAAEAARLLDDAGWTRAGDPSGRRTRNGQPFSFRLLVPEEASGIEPALTRIVYQLGQIGVEAKVTSVPFDRLNKLVSTLDFDAAVGSFVGSPDPIADLCHAWKSSMGRSYGYRSTNVDNLATKILEIADPAEQREMLLRAQDAIYADQPRLFLWQNPALWALRKRVRGVRFSLVGPTGFYPGARAWWVPAE